MSHLEDEIQRIDMANDCSWSIIDLDDCEQDALCLAALKDGVKPVDFFENGEANVLYDKTLSAEDRLNRLLNNLYAYLESDIANKIEEHLTADKK